MEKVKSLFSYYFKPNSLVWWSGICSIGLGTSLTFGDIESLKVVSEVFAELNGTSASPAQLILFGLTAVGIGARKGE